MENVRIDDVDGCRMSQVIKQIDKLSQSAELDVWMKLEVMQCIDGGRRSR